ncbi:hypothetical protein HBA54_20395 [Pelagibius litoralis]|uniref:Uncharacterized protein n=1 Tax=Pelagibius litoralis TaxID=374515 RepID=A0A967K9C8_9PROT|nr:hypothetical protein [Pelagibius litoralis]NIA70963.1 hypothetical protein [Pelagibius litoralis]
MLDPFGKPIPGLYVARECGKAFGHLYLGSENAAECIVSGEVAGRNAALRHQRAENDLQSQAYPKDVSRAAKLCA